MESSCSVRKRGGERGKKPGSSYKLSHDISSHPDGHDWTQRQAELAPWATKEVLDFVLCRLEQESGIEMSG